MNSVDWLIWLPAPAGPGSERIFSRVWNTSVLNQHGMSSLLRVRVSSFLAGVAVAGTAALIWLRDDVRHSFETLHTHVSSNEPPLPPPALEDAYTSGTKAPHAPLQTEGFSTNLDRRVRLLEERVASLEDSKGSR